MHGTYDAAANNDSSAALPPLHVCGGAVVLHGGPGAEGDLQVGQTPEPEADLHVQKLQAARGTACPYFAHNALHNKDTSHI